jgi:hypothetical protein
VHSFEPTRAPSKLSHPTCSRALESCQGEPTGLDAVRMNDDQWGVGDPHSGLQGARLRLFIVPLRRVVRLVRSEYRHHLGARCFLEWPEAADSRPLPCTAGRPPVAASECGSPQGRCCGRGSCGGFRRSFGRRPASGRGNLSEPRGNSLQTRR